MARASVLPVGLMVGGFRSTDSTAQRPKQIIWRPPFHRTFPRRCHSTPILRLGVNPNSHFASILHGQRKSHIHFAIHCSAGPGNQHPLFGGARKPTSIFRRARKPTSIFGPPANIHFTSILRGKMDVKWMLAPFSDPQPTSILHPFCLVKWM